MAKSQGAGWSDNNDDMGQKDDLRGRRRITTPTAWAATPFENAALLDDESDSKCVVEYLRDICIDKWANVTYFI